MDGARSFEVLFEASVDRGTPITTQPTPIVAAARFVQAVDALEVDSSLESLPSVVSIGRVDAGVRSNVIAETARVTGMIRTFDRESAMVDLVRRLGRAAADESGARVRFDFGDPIPVAVNHRDLALAMGSSLQSLFGPSNIVEMPLVVGAEDFAMFQRRIPGFLFFLGARTKGAREIVPNHSSRFSIDEGALPIGVAALATLAVDFLDAGRRRGRSEIQREADSHRPTRDLPHKM